MATIEIHHDDTPGKAVFISDNTLPELAALNLKSNGLKDLAFTGPWQFVHTDVYFRNIVGGYIYYKA